MQRGVKDVEIEDILLTPDGHLSVYAYAECTVLGLHQRFHVILVVNSRTSILRVQRGCKGCKDKSYISYTCWHRAPVSKHLDVMQSISPNNHKVRSDPRSCRRTAFTRSSRITGAVVIWLARVVYLVSLSCENVSTLSREKTKAELNKRYLSSHCYQSNTLLGPLRAPILAVHSVSEGAYHL